MEEKFFSGEVHQLNECNIATEVLGCSKTAFNAGEDTIARVETYRLRKVSHRSFYNLTGYRDNDSRVFCPGIARSHCAP